jgi:hypothetical protein
LRPIRKLLHIVAVSTESCPACCLKVSILERTGQAQGKGALTKPSKRHEQWAVVDSNSGRSVQHTELQRHFSQARRYKTALPALAPAARSLDQPVLAAHLTCHRRPGRVPHIKKSRLAAAFNFGAGNEIRTRDLNLGKVALYQLSYSRSGCTTNLGIYQMEARGGVEPPWTDLQSAA